MPHAPNWATDPNLLSDSITGLNLLFATPQSVPTLEMFDTVTLSTVPSWATVVAGYTSGYWPTYNALVRAFPHAIHVSVAVTAGHVADCLDVEPGDATPSQVPGWVRWMLSLGHKLPCVYSSVSYFQNQINPLLASAGLSGSVRRWCAWYRYFSGLIPGCDAMQWTDHALGRNLDEDTVSLHFLGLDVPAPAPHCFGPHAQTKLKKCVVVRREVAKWSRARASTVKALDRKDCATVVVRGNSVLTVRSGGKVCVTLFKRADWFNDRIKTHLY